MKALKKLLIGLIGAVVGCCFFAGCLSTKLSVTYMVDGETYRVQQYEMDSQISLPTAPTKEGYTFIGWYTDEALTVPYAEGAITAGLTLYAKFSVSSVYIVVNTAGGEKINAIEVTPGADYTIPEAQKEGYTFLGYTYIDEEGEEQDFPLSGKYPNSVGIRITAKYEVNKYNVTFVTDSESTQEVAYGSVAIAPKADKPGYEFDGWYTSATEQTEETKFDVTTAIKGDVTLYAKYTAKSFTITVNGAEQGYANPTVKFGEAYTLPTPSRGSNYEFVMFTKGGEEFSATGTYTWTENITVDVVWDGVGKDVMFFDGNSELSSLRIETEYDADLTTLQLPNVPAKEGYATDNKWYTDAACTQEFALEGKVSTDIRLYAKYTANEYTITFVVWDKATKTTKNVPVTVTYGESINNIPEKAYRDAYDFKGYFYGETVFDTTKVYTYAKDVTVVEKWELRADASKFNYNQAGNYFTERDNYDADWTYVYLIGVTYTFGDLVELSLVNSVDEVYATVNGNQITINAAGEFELQVNTNGNVEVRKIKAVDYIQSLSVGGTAYDEAWGLNEAGTDYKRNTTDVWDKKVAVDAGEVMKVGRTNFIPELSINGKIATFDTASINVSVKVGGVETTDYSVANGAINFGASLVGQKVEVTLVPKYNVGNYKAVYNVEVNNAVNVYTNEDMKASFANTSVTEINILRKIEVALSDDQVIKFAVNGWEIVSPKNYSDIDSATGVYERRSGSLKINGNYFTVDGSKLPLIDARSGEKELCVDPDGSTYRLLDTRFAIFLFGTRKTLSNDVYSVDNLNVIGNGKMDAAAGYTMDGKTVLQYSGAAIGIEVGCGELNMNNVTSRFGSFSLLASTPTTFEKDGVPTLAVTINATDCKLEKSWANNIYVHGSIRLNLDSCFIGAANGAAIHFDTRPTTIAIDGELNLLNDTDIQNWVTGQEAWFTAQNATAVVPELKSTVENYVQRFSGGKLNAGTYTGGARTIKNAEGKINFAILMRRKGDAGDWTGGKDALGANWLQHTDAYYQGYTSGATVYGGQGAMALNLPTLDLGYVTFMQTMAGYGQYYTAKQVETYCYTSAMTNKYVMAPSTAMGYMEVYIGLNDVPTSNER